MTAAATSAPPRRELDDVTLARARAGDPAAFQRLVETYQDAVFALLWRFFGSRRDVVEDVAQTAFLGVYRGLARFEPAGTARLSTWVLAIAARTALNVRRNTRPTVALETVIGTPHEPSTLRTGDVDHRRFVDALVGALERLAPPYRVVFLLREYHDLDYREIATGLDLDLGTVKSRLSRPRSQLRAELQEYAP